MTTIANKLTRIASAKESIKAAIEAKGVEVADAPLADYAGKVEEIKSGEAEEAPIKDVNFMDYDGFNLYSYTWAEALALTELPPLPSHEGLICQGWNYTLAEIKANGGQCDVGANYITDDGATRLYINVSSDSRREVVVHFYQSSGGKITIDWGDGKNYTTSLTGGRSASHTYNDVGKYVIRLIGLQAEGLNLNNVPVIGANAVTDRAINNMLYKLELGDIVTTLSANAFRYCYSLRSVSIPRNVTTINEAAFSDCYALQGAVIPNGVSIVAKNQHNQNYALRRVSLPISVTTINETAYQDCRALGIIVLPKDLTTLGQSVFNQCRQLRSLNIPAKVSAITQTMFSDCHALTRLIMPAVTTINHKALYNCMALPELVFPATLTTIATYAFSQCYSLVLLDFRAATSVPTLQSTSLDNVYNFKVVVPDSLYDTWVAATNWSSYAANIIKASDYSG